MSDTSKEMEMLITLIKKNFKERAEMEIVATAFGTVDNIVIVEEGNSGRYGLIIPMEWKTKDFTGVNLEELAVNIKFSRGYRLKDLLED